MNKKIIISIIIAISFIFFALIVVNKNKIFSEENLSEVPINNVSIVDGIQIIEIKAKGGYQPRKSIAKAGLPTLLRFDTNGTFDCSSIVRIPSMNITESLPQVGETDIDLGVQKAGILNGSCGMGMYPFEIIFE